MILFSGASVGGRANDNLFMRRVSSACCYRLYSVWEMGAFRRYGDCCINSITERGIALEGRSLPRGTCKLLFRRDLTQPRTVEYLVITAY